jgi:hypothetical protein
MAADTQNDKEPIRTQRRHSVALSMPSDATFNTLELGGLDILIPLERDLDKRPELADVLRLSSDDGSYSRMVTSEDPNVKQHEDTPLLLYRFPDVPPGHYSIAVQIADRWTTVVHGLRVSRTNVFLGDRSFEAELDGKSLGKPEPEGEDPEEEPFFDDDETCPCCA